MPLSLNEIRKRSIEFSKEWEKAISERADAKTFWDQFFNVFGVSRKRVASFEEPVKKPDGQHGYIDLLWKGVVLVEHKSKGKNLDTAYKQAKDYFPGLKDQELPRYVVVSDFEKFKVYDLIDSTESAFNLSDLAQNINLFGFISGYHQRTFKEQEPVNIQAAELMGELHDTLLANGYTGHELEVLLVRILFCLFAEDTTIFDKQQFTDYIERRTGEDGSDLGMHLAQLFEVLNTPVDKRVRNLDEELNAFEYVNGSLFAEQLHFASFNSEMRKKILTCCYFDWSQISPAIFGSMFQHVMDEVDAKHRRELGAHYTSEKNIMKLIKGLFLDELWLEFDSVKNSKTRLEKFHDKISKFKFLDPACGCGNFLIITYRELRLIEIEILKILKKGQMVTDIRSISKIDVDAFYGIEYEEFPAQIATVAMWLSDHQMNMRLSQEFGEYYKRLPLKNSATIIHGNALRLNWADIVSKPSLSYILGNPPFVGKQLMNKDQDFDMDTVFKGVKAFGVLDYVTAWYLKAAQFIQGTSIKVAFVSTNSISQGEQVGILWNELFKYGLKIFFAHRTFKWTNEAKGNAAVFVVIIGFSQESEQSKSTDRHLFDYPDVKGEPLVIKTKKINPYLVSADDVLVLSRTKPMMPVPEMIYGSKPVDDGNFIFDDDEKKAFIALEPNAEKFIKPLLSAKEYLNGDRRWCLWLKNAKPEELRRMPAVLDRIEKVKHFRLASTKAPTRESAQFASVFAEIRQPESEFVLVPIHTSETRKYIPFSYYSKDNILSNSCMGVPNSGLYHFGIIISEMHMTWAKYVCGRIKSDFRYSNTLVYNNFPWPETLPKQKYDGIEKLAQQVLRVRERYPDSSLADLYDPLTMPADLVRAHQDLDRFVDTCYRPLPFDTEMQRIEFLFDLYKKYTEPLFGSEKSTKKKAKITG